MTENRTTQAGNRRRWLRGLLPGCIAAMLLTPVATAASDPELIPGGWEASVETSAFNVDHGAWQQVLDAHLRTHPSGINRFDYGGLKASAEDRARVAGYLAYLQALDPRTFSRAEQKAYWINFYNALTVQVVTDAYPVDSIKDIHESLLPFPIGPWGDVHAEVAGMELTLDDIEHGILRPIWGDPRIHYGVNCASLGCANPARKVYTASNTEALLEAASREYINHPRGVDFIDEDFIVISSIYNWFVVDFGDSEQSVIEHLARYAEPGLAARLEVFSGEIEYGAKAERTISNWIRFYNESRPHSALGGRTPGEVYRGMAVAA